MIKLLRKLARSVLKRKASGLAGLPQGDKDLIQSIKEKKLTYLSNAKLASIVRTCREIEEKRLPGIYVEAGCALGGSSILISKLKASSRIFNVYDVFGMIPPPTEMDTQDVHDRYATIAKGESKGLGGDPYYGYQENLYEIVRENLRSFGVECGRDSVTLIKGLLQETMEISGPVAFAHIDVDWYDPVMYCLKKIYPNLVAGGSIILDDYHDWGGCRKAADEFLGTIDGGYSLSDSARSMKITKNR